MVLKKKLLLLITLLTSLVISVCYLLSFLAADYSRESVTTVYHETSQRPFRLSPLLSDIHNSIYKQLLLLASSKPPPVRRLSIATDFTKSYADLWTEANSWASKDGIVDFDSPHLGEVLGAMRRAKIVKADVFDRGTQIKLMLTLEGGQDVIFKPELVRLNWSAPDDAHSPVFGWDRPRAEVVGFYVSFLLNAPKTAPAVTRTVSLRDDVVPVATRDLLETIFEKTDGSLCLYGKCVRCRKSRHVCGEEHDGLLEGAVVFKLTGENLNEQVSPWKRRYVGEPSKKWEHSRSYCDSVKAELELNVVLDLIDQAIYDFLIQNGDRHHFEVDRFGTMIWLDNGKGFGNPRVDYLDILAPLYQCCIVRKRTLEALEALRGDGHLKKVLESMPEIEELVMKAHLDAIERRLALVFATVKYCDSIGGEYKVL